MTKRFWLQYSLVALVALCFILCFLSITFGTLAHSYLFNLDVVIAQYAATFSSEGMAKFMLFFTYLGNREIVLSLEAFLIIVFIFTRQRTAIMLSLAGIIASQYFSTLFKTLSHRARPDYLNYLTKHSSDSFPSGHALIGLVFYGMIAYIWARHLKKRWQRISLVIGVTVVSVLVGLSRIYLGVHWFSDVVGGWALGAVILFALITIFEHTQAHAARTGKKDKAHSIHLHIIIALLICEAFFIYYFYVTHPLVFPMLS